MYVSVCFFYVFYVWELLCVGSSMTYTFVFLLVLKTVEFNIQQQQPFVLLMILPVIQVLSLPSTSQHYGQLPEKDANHLMQVILKSAGSDLNAENSPVCLIYH